MHGTRIYTCKRSAMLLWFVIAYLAVSIAVGLIAAMRVLGRFPDTPGIAQKVLPLLLDSPWLKVQEVAAQLLSRVPDPAVAGLGTQWGEHGAIP